MIFLLLSSFIARAEPYFALDNKEYPKLESTYVVDHLSPIKDQDSIGICYSFASTVLAEQYRCRTLNQDCSRPEQFMSPYHMASFDQAAKGIGEGGAVGTVLSNFQQSARMAVKEDCAPFSSLLPSDKDQSISPKVGLNILDQNWGSFHTGSSETPIGCAAVVKSSLPSLLASARQIEKALEEKTLESFRFHAIIPDSCLENNRNQLKVPPFKIGRYPESGEVFEKDKFYEIVEQQIRNDKPLAAEFCLRLDCAERYKENPAATDIAAHALVITGIQRRCNDSDCKVFLKLQNSYGRQWQDIFSDGWVDGDQFSDYLKKFYELSKVANIHWLNAPGDANRTSNRTSKSRSSVKVRPAPNIHTRIWKCKTSSGGTEYRNSSGPDCTPMSGK